MRALIFAGLFLELTVKLSFAQNVAVVRAPNKEFAMSSVSAQTKWLLFFESMNGSKEFIETTTLVRTRDGNVRAWRKTIGASDEKQGTLTLLEIDCKERAYTIRALEAYGSAPEALHSALEKIQAQWREPKQNWEYLGLSDLDLAEYRTYCERPNHVPAKK